MLPVDALVPASCHIGRARRFGISLDPSVPDERDVLRPDPDFDMFNEKNGPSYDREWPERYADAQQARHFPRKRTNGAGLIADLADTIVDWSKRPKRVSRNVCAVTSREPQNSTCYSAHTSMRRISSIQISHHGGRGKCTLFPIAISVLDFPVSLNSD